MDPVDAAVPGCDAAARSQQARRPDAAGTVASPVRLHSMPSRIGVFLRNSSKHDAEQDQVESEFLLMGKSNKFQAHRP